MFRNKLVQKCIKVSANKASSEQPPLSIIEQTNASQAHPALQIATETTTGLRTCHSAKAHNEVFNDAIICIASRPSETRAILTPVFTNVHTFLLKLRLLLCELVLSIRDRLLYFYDLLHWRITNYASDASLPFNLDTSQAVDWSEKYLPANE